ncbi:hypothetical protein RRG08_056055 [Elysia crispata]|uniref:Uncharacterized protein n=1 Tax=Elysia crispata TaxID=231223 RepID=A0AAE1DDD2_9GAST|nr:hypothetical protein RRG08_056055 [Elysia crispata]
METANHRNSHSSHCSHRQSPEPGVSHSRHESVTGSYYSQRLSGCATQDFRMLQQRFVTSFNASNTNLILWIL